MSYRVPLDDAERTDALHLAERAAADHDVLKGLCAELIVLRALAELVRTTRTQQLPKRLQPIRQRLTDYSRSTRLAISADEHRTNEARPSPQGAQPGEQQ